MPALGRRQAGTHSPPSGCDTACTNMPEDITRLRGAIAALEAQRDTLGADLVELALAPLRERLAQAQNGAPAQQLRQVSVLFTDVVGSTALSQALGPEQIAAVLDGALARFTRIVEQHGGCTLQYAGDSLLAAFGTPVAHEDDAPCAVRAALHILADAREQEVALQQRHGLQGFGVRAGIATGSVLLGGGVDGEHSIRGMTVNLAARMEQSAPPGMLRICPDTRRLVRGLFDLVEQPPLQVKGRDEPILTWLVQAAALEAGVAFAGRAARGVGGLATALVGRDTELALLRESHARWCAQAAPGVAVHVVLGDAGLGKSRLVAEFRAWTLAQGHGAQWLDAQAGERAQGRPYGLLRQLFTRRLRLLDSDAAASARDKWLNAMTDLLPSRSDAAVLGHLLGLDFSAHDEVAPLLAESRQLRDRAFFHASQALRRLAAQGPPLLALLEDLHWADAGTLDFIEHLQTERADVPLLLLATARPTLEEQRPGWSVAMGRRCIELAPLSDAVAHQLASLLLAGLVDNPDRLTEHLTLGAAGNPFFMEELVNMLMDRGVIVAEDDAAGLAEEGSAATPSRWRLRPDRLDKAGLPSTLAGVLQARLDDLPGEEAHALQLAAIVGPVFWDDALLALQTPGRSGPLPLLMLAQRQLIVERASSSLEGRREFAFRHHLLHQVCYERVLQRVKQPAHARVARWLESLPGDRPHELIAEHHERGGQAESARDAWQQAAERAQARYANTLALAHAERALQLTCAQDLARRYELTLLQARVLALVGEPARLQSTLDTLDELAEALDDDTRRSQAGERRASFLIEAGDAQAVLRIAEHATRRAPAQAPPAPHTALWAGKVTMQALHLMGRYAEAQRQAEQTLALARQIGDRRTEGVQLNGLGVLAADHGDIAGSIAWYTQALACHRETGNHGHEAGVLCNLGYAELGLGAYDAAAERLLASRALFANVGQRRSEGVVLINLALVDLNTGQPQKALDHALEALPLLTASGSRGSEAAALRVRGQARSALGQAQAAFDDLASALELFTELRMPHLALEVRACLAPAAWALGRQALAIAHAVAVRDPLMAGEQFNGAEEPVRMCLDCWRVLHDAGDASAAATLGSAHALLMRRAERIADPLQRASFLQRVPPHRALLQAWASGRAAD